MTYRLITQAQQIIQAAIDDPTAPPTVVAWQAAHAIVEAGWEPPPGGDVLRKAAAICAHPVMIDPVYRPDECDVCPNGMDRAQALADAGLLRTPPQQDAEAVEYAIEYESPHEAPDMSGRPRLHRMTVATLDTARQAMSFKHSPWDKYRNRRVVQRLVTPWEPTDD